MRRSRVTITLNKKLLDETDELIDGEKIRNRSHAIEFILSQYFQTNIQKAVILAGGKGTKMRPFTYEMPKSLLPIKGKPILAHLIENLKKNGIDEIILCTGYLGEKIKDCFGDGKRFGVTITYSQESKSRQTGGALMAVKKYLTEPFLLIYGDILTELSFLDLISFHIQQPSLATIALTAVDEPSDFGQLKLHGLKLVNFYQKKANYPSIQSHLVNCGMYVLEPEIFDFFPKKKSSFFLEDVIEKLISAKKVNGFVFEGQWFDVGNPKNYEKAIREFKTNS